MGDTDLESLSSASICQDENILLDYEEKIRTLEDRLFEEQSKISALLSENTSLKEIFKQVLEDKIAAENELDILKLENERVKFSLNEKDDEVEKLKSDSARDDSREKILELEEELVKVYGKLVEVNDERDFFKNLFESLSTEKSSENSKDALNQKELKLVTEKFEEQKELAFNRSENLEKISVEAESLRKENKNLKRISFESKMLLNQLGRENAELKDNIRQNQENLLVLKSTQQNCAKLESEIQIKNENIKNLLDESHLVKSKMQKIEQELEELKEEREQFCENFEMAKNDLLICRRRLNNREETILVQNLKIDALEDIVRRFPAPKSKFTVSSQTPINQLVDSEVQTETNACEDQDFLPPEIHFQLPDQLEEDFAEYHEYPEEHFIEEDEFSQAAESQESPPLQMSSIEESIQQYFDEFCAPVSQEQDRGYLLSNRNIASSRSSSRISGSTLCSTSEMKEEERKYRRKIRQLEVAFNKAMSSKRRKAEKLQALEHRLLSIAQNDEKLKLELEKSRDQLHALEISSAVKIESVLNSKRVEIEKMRKQHYEDRSRLFQAEKHASRLLRRAKDAEEKVEKFKNRNNAEKSDILSEKLSCFRAKLKLLDRQVESFSTPKNSLP
ncbi:Oidioi.mRNA.OKI2018_I69.chr2.g7405.t1.cds [Oikopleura dioica]|uniref:Oidioi.mRNA.OKI2018_I69.chr2.g7405.t1.cds n=1 Tax=Oikopleura dioica TaxID=34765 RepID=A0ABN7T629_OIKDI|nr:Oidioi.mRNA.OKI2018_I69.chr2.g7405.t1.cds [Oikopleura dioica]